LKKIGAIHLSRSNGYIIRKTNIEIVLIRVLLCINNFGLAKLVVLSAGYSAASTNKRGGAVCFGCGIQFVGVEGP
jgi:hypothetical protein